MDRLHGLNTYTLLFLIWMIPCALYQGDSARADDFCVASASDIQTALNTAASNGTDDLIQIVQGEYAGLFTFTTQEAHRLRIKGGYLGTDCASRTLSPANTVLNGNDSGRVMTVAMSAPVDFECEGLSFENGNAQTGGGLAVTTSGNVILNRNRFMQNHASETGGGLHISPYSSFVGSRRSDSGGAITMTNNTISNNSAGAAGAAHLDLFAAELRFNIITNNTADNDGGGLQLDCASMTLISNIVSRNTAGLDGGGIQTSGESAVLTGNSLSGNRAEGDGGGVWTDCDAITIGDANFSGNKAGADGGAIHASRGSVSIDGNNITGNSAGANGGGIGAAGAAVTITGNAIIANMADNGGGIHAEQGSAVIINNMFNGNTALQEMGAVGIDCDSALVVNNTISNNMALNGPGGGVAVLLRDDSDGATLRNNIVYQNNAWTGGNDFYIDNDYDGNQTASSVTLDHNNFDQGADGLFISAPFAVSATNLNNLDPMFMDSTTGNYQLSKGSPCIDAGSAVDAPSVDIDNVSRPLGLTHDMGAYEYEGAPVAGIRVNGSAEDITVTAADDAEIMVSLDPDILTGQEADWWLLQLTPEGEYYFLAAGAGEMVQSDALFSVAPYSQMGLRRLEDHSLLTLSCLPIGPHFFAFAVDLDKNGVLNANNISFDVIRVDRVLVDEDGDGYQSDGCETAWDCNDSDASIHPGAFDVCDDGIDQDCSGADLNCRDVDNDGDGYTENQGDCNDGSASVHPGATEIRDDGVDQDCNGADLLAAAVDDDGDGHTENQGDCNDGAPAIHPGATEIRDDGVDQDCDGADLLGVNIDDDGDGVAESQGDCNDYDDAIHPGAAEVRDDGVDQDCDGGDLLGVNIDDDGDGYTENQGDCLDDAPAIHPAAHDVCDDGIDQDCSGADLDCDDVDNDGDGYTENQGDCDDASRSIHPLASEIPNDGVDQDCNGHDFEHDNP